MKILISGAHFTPAQAVIEELLKFKKETDIRKQSLQILSQRSFADAQDDTRIVYVGRRTTREGDRSLSVESQVLPKMGVKFISITAGRISRYISFASVISLFKIPIGFVQAFIILLKEQPNVVVSFGGYVSVPLVFMAWLLNIRVIIHEQTLVSGLANTFSALFADKIAVSFEQGYSFNKSKTMVTGNPMRRKIIEPVQKGSKEIEEMINLSEKQKKPLILITGGNQGSHSINEVVEEGLEELTKKYVVIHQTGDSKFKDYERLAQKQDSGSKVRGTIEARMTAVNYYVTKWISEDDMGRLYANVDFVVSRCGANTLLELAYHQIPTVMIPLLFATKDEQTKNAKFFSAKGLGVVLSQKDLSVENLLEKIGLVNTFQAKIAAKDAKNVVILGAEKKLAQEILLLEYKS